MRFIFFQGGGRLLACQVVGSLAILVWVTVNSCAIIYALKCKEFPYLLNFFSNIIFSSLSLSLSSSG